MINFLKKYFGYNEFRPLQEEIINSVIEWSDVFVLMPTGWWKSVCYQLPAIVLSWLTIVVSPLIALMKDQVDSLIPNWISAAFINSSLSISEIYEIERKILLGKIKIVYIAPERLSNVNFQKLIDKVNISLIAIDEAHCISEWWHDFRPDYNNLSTFKVHFPNSPIIALTATATYRVREDIINKLNLRNPKKFISSFDRPNLTIKIIEKEKYYEKIKLLLNKYNNESVIIYCFSRKDTEKITNKLIKDWFNAIYYHGGMSSGDRKINQDLFINDNVNIVVATIAFWMWIDKPDVRLVIHTTFPKTLEGYYQEIWRAGRDWLSSDCVLFYNWWDKRKHEFFLDRISNDDEREKESIKLQQIIKFCESRICRKKYILNYFWEEIENCGNCDICLEKKEEFDATEISQKILSAIYRTWSTFGSTYIVDVLRWSTQKSIIEKWHDRLSVFWIVDDFSKEQLKHLIKSLIWKWIVIQSSWKYPTLSVSVKWKERLKNRETIKLVVPPEKEVTLKQLKNTNENINNSEIDKELFDNLRKVRKKIAEDKWIPPFVVFHDTTLIQMCQNKPKNEIEFLQLTGVWEQKLKQYGKIFLEAINWKYK